MREGEGRDNTKLVEHTHTHSPSPLGDLQEDRYGDEELSCVGELFTIVYLFPVGESPCCSLIPCRVGRALQVVEHDVHALQ